MKNLPPRRGSNPGPAEPEADMLPSEQARRAIFWNVYVKNRIYKQMSNVSDKRKPSPAYDTVDSISTSYLESRVRYLRPIS